MKNTLFHYFIVTHSGQFEVIPDIKITKCSASASANTTAETCIVYIIVLENIWNFQDFLGALQEVVHISSIFQFSYSAYLHFLFFFILLYYVLQIN